MQSVLGYHGNELRFYDDLMGGKNVWSNIGNPNLHDLLAVRFLVLPDTQSVPGFRRLMGPTPTTHGSVGVLYERDTVPPYVRVLPAAAKLPEEQLVPTVIDPRFPVSGVVVFPEYGLGHAGADSRRRPGHDLRPGAAHRVEAGKHAGHA